MARMLITGANGFVGKALCAELLEHGHVVRAASRATGSVMERVDITVVGSIDDKTDWTGALAGIDVVIHLAARVHVMHEKATDPLEEFRRVNTVGTEHLARAAAISGVKRMVFASSIKVNGEETTAGHRFSEHDIPAPQDPYGVSKWEAEQALHRVSKETGLEVVVVRPPLVYGPGVKGNYERLMSALSKGMVLPFASVNNVRSMLYVENLVDAIRVCATSSAASGNTYLLCDGEDVSTPTLLRQMGAAMEKPVCLIPCPLTLLKTLGFLLGKSSEVKRLLGSLQIDNSKIRHDLNWQPPFTLQEGLDATAKKYLDTMESVVD
jgi:nucleoside-diphosphate-sugar epimerase